MPADNYGYYKPPTVSAARPQPRATGSLTTEAPASSSTGAIVVVSLAGLSLLGFGAWLLSQPDVPRRPGARR